MTIPSVSLKLLIDAKRGTVLFAETAENLAAVIYEMLSYPDNAITLLLKQDTAAGSLANLCKSIQSVDDKSDIGVYCCRNFCYFAYSDYPFAVCTRCFGYMDATLAYVAPPPVRPAMTAAAGRSGEGPFHIITDDLEIMPMSAIPIVNLIKRLGIEDVGALEEKVVDFGRDEAIKLVNASKESKKVLTDVFLKEETVESESECLDEFEFELGAFDSLVTQWKKEFSVEDDMEMFGSM